MKADGDQGQTVAQKVAKR